MDAQTAITRLSEFQIELKRVSTGGETAWKIFKNDLDEFNAECFNKESKDYTILNHGMRPAMIIGAMTRESVIIARKAASTSEAIELVLHRLQKGQATPKDSPEPDERLLEAGRPHAAYIFLREIVSKVNNSICILDPYVGPDLLGALANAPPGSTIRILTYRKRIPLDFNTELAKFEKETGLAIEVRCGTEDFHDRFLLTDSQLFHSGASFKDLGVKMSAITEIKDVKRLLEKMIEDRWNAAVPL